MVFQGSRLARKARIALRELAHSEGVVESSSTRLFQIQCGRNVSCDIVGGKRTIALFKPVLEDLEWDWSGLCLFPLNDRVWTKGREKRTIGGGVQNRFWGGVYGVFSPTPEFSAPSCHSLIFCLGGLA